MITLDTNLYLLSTLFDISPRRLSQYTDKSIDEIMEIEAANGNTKAARFDSEVFNNPDQLMELFQLSDENNRFAILQNMSQNDLTTMLPMLEQQDLVVGLNYFTKDKLLNLLGDIPTDQLVKYTSQMFSQEQMMQMMPEDQIDKVLMSPDMDKDAMLATMKSLKPAILMQMIENATGESAMSGQNSMNMGQPATDGITTDESGIQSRSSGITGETVVYNQKYELVNKMSELPADKFNDAILSMPPQTKKNFMLTMAKNNEKIFNLFNNSSYINMVSQKEKPELVKAATALKGEQLVKMTSQLPQILLANLVTQIEPNKFASILTSKYKGILSQIVAG